MPTLLYITLLLTSLLSATQVVVSCGLNNACPSSAPCCSSFNYCGSDSYYCLGGCNPYGSNSFDSCAPNPVCKSANYTFSDISRIALNMSEYDGDADKYDWVLQQGSVFTTTSDGESAIGLTLTEQTSTLMTSTRYVHYGQITARMKTGKWSGVVAAFVTFSSINDEIDWEFPGNQTTQGQTNYFWQGVIPTVDRGLTLDGLTDTHANWHNFGIDWQPHSLKFLVDGDVKRTIMASDCVDNTTDVTEFPNTPSRIQLSIWAGGSPSESPGIRHWAGEINWNDPDYISAGNFSTLFQSISVQCNDPTPPGTGVTGYVYGATNSSLDTPTINFTNDPTVVNSTSPQPGRNDTTQSFTEHARRRSKRSSRRSLRSLLY